jgi:IclR family transcriptional regulator, mhp operon transcriptional activator
MEPFAAARGTRAGARNVERSERSVPGERAMKGAAQMVQARSVGVGAGNGTAAPKRTSVAEAKPAAAGDPGTQVRSIRAVERALSVVALLAAADRLTVAQVARASNLPRTTAYRVLRTLVAQGFATEWPEFGTFGPGPVLARLAKRRDPLAEVVEAARPFARELSERVRWPVSIASVLGDEVVVRYSTDAEAALACTPRRPGTRLPILESAAGRLQLAYADRDEQALWLDLAYARQGPRGTPAPERATLEVELATIRRQGYAAHARDGRLTVRRSLAAPVFGPQGFEASLVLRFAERAIRTRAELLELVGQLRESAAGASAMLGGHVPVEA